MSSQRRPSRVSAQSPDQPKAKPPAKANGKSKEQRDSRDTEDQSRKRAEDKGAPKRESTKQSKKEKTSHDCDSEHKPQEKRGTIDRQSKKQRDLSKRDGQSEEKHSLTRSASGLNNGNNAGENDRKETSQRQSKKTSPHDRESEGKPRQSAESASGEKTAPKRQSKKQRDPSNFDRQESQESSDSKSEEKPRKRHESDARNAHDAPPELSARKKSAEKAVTRGMSVDDTRGKILKETIEKLKIKTRERSNASSCVNGITDKVISHLKQNTTWCAEIECLRTGSYYENLKICEPDEFDVMLTVPVERVDLMQYDDDGAFYSVALKRHAKHPLDKFLNEDKIIQASKMLSEFRDAVKEAVKKLEGQYTIEVQRKKPRCPAVTLEVKENEKIISIDFVLGLKVRSASWPAFTKDGFKIENWLGKKEKMDMKRQPFYLVSKYVGKGDAEHDGVVAKDSWRISLSHIEKEILQRHGHSKTCCEPGGKKCCRKECLKLLKYLLQLLKEDDSISNKMSNICSYHAKTTLLHACATRGDDDKWEYNQLANCFQQLLEDFVKHLRDRHLPNFFIPSHNLLQQVTQTSCDFLVNKIEFQWNNNFPIFSKF